MENEQFNLDDLVLTLDSTLVFDKYADIETNTKCYREGYYIQMLEKDDELTPNIYYLLIAFPQDSTPINIGVIKFAKKEESIFYADNHIFYQPFSWCSKGKISLATTLEPILDDLGFELEKIKVSRMKIVRDSLRNVLADISIVNGNSNYALFINEEEVKDSLYIVDKFFISDDSNTNDVKKMKKQKVCHVSNILGTVQMKAYCMSDKIRDISHEDYIKDYTGFGSQKFYRTEITLNGNQLRRFYREIDIEDNGYYTICRFIQPDCIKALFDYLSPKLLYYKNIKNEKIKTL